MNTVYRYEKNSPGDWKKCLDKPALLDGLLAVLVHHFKIESQVKLKTGVTCELDIFFEARFHHDEQGNSSEMEIDKISTSPKYANWHVDQADIDAACLKEIYVYLPGWHVAGAWDRQSQ